MTDKKEVHELEDGIDMNLHLYHTTARLMAAPSDGEKLWIVRELCADTTCSGFSVNALIK